MSLGAAQPDSLAIKRIIDEGHSIRAIKKALLKGNFDARQYLSELRSRATQGLITTRKPPLLTQRASISQVNTSQLLPLAGRSESTYESAFEWVTGSQQPVSTATSWPRGTDPILPSLEEEVSAFTGKLPALALPDIVDDFYQQEQPASNERVVTSSRNTANRDTSKLWSYVNQAEVTKVEKRR